ncbi:hypothetical protein K466DRAFT_201161 [Polyporus arcularius HHB13444]|uniref:Uncharacterized protein n=1 Tax=Polyporus arcularius HHB13444 TaxID=1314778 RepID=A0A5C3PVC1_9APHY|nr:hypothetical protein K466DRAFT_201161 [Polyporus arcularius HHB13444]
MGRVVSREPSALSSSEADKSNNGSVKASPWQALDETFPTPNSLLNAPPLGPELTVDHAAAHELIPGPQLIVPERIPTPVFDPRLRGDLLTRYNFPRAKDDHALQALGTMGRRLKRRGALAVKDLKIQMRGALGSHFKFPSFRDSSRHVSAPSAISSSGHSRSGSSSLAQHSPLSSRPTHTRSASHSYAHDLLLHESTMNGCDCAICDLVLRRCHELRDTSLPASNLLDPSITPRPTPSHRVSLTALHDALYGDPKSHNDFESSSAPAESVEAPEAEERHNKPLPDVPYLPAEPSSGHYPSPSDETTSSRDNSLDTADHSVRSRSVRRVPVPQESDSEPEPKSRDAPSHKGSSSDLSDVVSDLDVYDEAENRLRLQVLGAINHQKRAFWCADPANWSTVTLVATNNPDNRSKLRMDDRPADARSASDCSDPSDNLSTVYDGQQWMLTPVLPEDDDYHPSRLTSRRARNRKVRSPPDGEALNIVVRLHDRSVRIQKLLPGGRR